MKSFGSVRQQAVKRHKVETYVRTILEASGHHPNIDKPETAGNLDIVPFDCPRTGVLVEEIAGRELANQVSPLRRLARQQKKDERSATEAKTKQLRQHLCEPCDLYGLDLPKFGSDDSKLRIIRTGPFLHVAVDDSVCELVQGRVPATVANSNDAVAACSKVWKRVHLMVTDALSPGIPPVPDNATATYCHWCGGGFCFCKGRGFVLRLIYQNMGREIVGGAPTQSAFRKLMAGAFCAFKI